MRRRTRKFAGGMAMLAFVMVYALCAMALAQAKPVQEANAAVQALVYVILGLFWVVPLLPLIAWMERGD